MCCSKCGVPLERVGRLGGGQSQGSLTPPPHLLKLSVQIWYSKRASPCIMTPCPHMGVGIRISWGALNMVPPETYYWKYCLVRPGICVFLKCLRWFCHVKRQRNSPPTGMSLKPQAKHSAPNAPPPCPRSLMPCPSPQTCSLMKRLRIPKHAQALSPSSFHSSLYLPRSLPRELLHVLWDPEKATPPLPQAFYTHPPARQKFCFPPESHSTTPTYIIASVTHSAL